MSSITLAVAPNAGVVPLRQDASVIALVGLAHASSHFSHLLLPLMFPAFIREFGLSYSQLGLLMTVFFSVSGSGQALSGFVVDRVGPRRILFAALGALLLACLAAALAQGYVGLMLVAALAGLGNASFHPVDFTLLNQRVSAPRLGYAYSVHGVTGNLGWAAAPAFLVGLSSLWGWRWAYAGAALLYGLIILLLLANRALLHTQLAPRHAQAGVGNDLAFMKLPVVWWCFSFFLLSTMTLAVVQGFAVSILKAMHGVTFEAATLTLSAYMLCGAVGVFVGGFVAARTVHSDRVVALTMPINVPNTVSFLSHCVLHVLHGWGEVLRLPVPELL
ncbi:MAG: MFS transporter, partial [Betaproteobacteria bacterium]